MRLAVACACAVVGLSCSQSAGPSAAARDVERPAERSASIGPIVVPGTCYSTHYVAEDFEPSLSAIDRSSNLLAKPRRDDYREPEPLPAKPMVRIVGKPRVSAEVDRAQLEQALARAVQKFRDCYGKALQDNPRLSGTRTITLDITADGTVSAAAVTGRDETLRTCVENTLVLAKMPAPPGGTPMKVVFTVRFKPAVSASAVRRLPAPPPLCEGIAESSPLASVVSALQRCYDIALLDDPSLGGRVDMRVAPSGAVDFAGDVAEPLGGCMRNVLSRASFDTQPDMATVCTLLLDNPSAPPSPDEVRLAIDLDDVSSIDGRILGNSDLEGRELPYASARALQSVIPDPLDDDRAVRPRLVIRAHPGVDTDKVERVVDHLTGAALTSVSFARSVGVTDAWSVVNPLGSPSDPFCRPERTSVSVLLTERGFAVLSGGMVAYFEAGTPEGERDFDALSTALTTLRNTTLANRSDLSIAAAPATTYRDLLRTLELGIEAGYFDARHAQYSLVSALISGAAKRASGGVE